MNKDATKYKLFRPWLHIAVWGVYFFVLVWPVMMKKQGEHGMYMLAHFFILIFTVYLNNLVLVKLYFHRERYMRYFISLIILWILGLVAVFFSGLLLPLEQRKIKYFNSAAVAYFLEFWLLAFYKAGKEWYIKSKKAKDLEFEKMQAELSLLRSQMDSHFIFNTLNNLYLLVLNKSDKAPDAVLKLSDLLSYIIYDSSRDRVALADELSFIANYISLQQMRLHESQQIHFMVNGSATGVVEPLILFNFIENAFKHATGSVEVDGNTYFVYIRIDIDTVLRLVTVNSYGPVHSHGEYQGTKGGVGLANVMKRLDAVYGDRYELKIDKTNYVYTAELVINTRQ